ncbi:ALQxL family class IV lanthipeptide [Streptosporangium sp. NPDC002607]
MELDIDALDMLPAAKETQLYPCEITCTYTCKGTTCKNNTMI